jgi:hypothetical protein
MEDKKKEEEKKPEPFKEGNLLFWPPQPKEEKADSIFNPGDEVSFENITKAKIYIGTKLEILGTRYEDWADLCDILLADTLEKEAIEAMIGEIQKEMHKKRMEVVS